MSALCLDHLLVYYGTQDDPRLRMPVIFVTERAVHDTALNLFGISLEHAETASLAINIVEHATGTLPSVKSVLRKAPVFAQILDLAKKYKPQDIEIICKHYQIQLAG